MVTVDGQWVQFEFYRPEVEHVFLAGDFNDWREHELMMKHNGDGYWKAKMRLPSGDFKFRYCADGVWYTDYAAFGVEPGRHGLDSIVRVDAQPIRMSAPTEHREAAVAAA